MVTPSPGSRGGARSRSRQAAIELDVRREVARELHDRVAQTLTAMLVDVENFKSQQVGWDDVLKELEEVQSSTRQVLSNLRHLLHDLRGDEHAGKSFVEAVQALLTKFAEKSRIAAELEVGAGWPSALTPPASLNLYRIVEEALSNVRMHSGATSVRVVLDGRAEDHVALSVHDDGRGVDTDADRPSGLGMIGMKERALLLGGQIVIESAVGVGTTVKGLFPKVHVVAQSDSASAPEFMMQGA